MPAFRKHTFNNLSTQKTLIEFYHHTSPIPYEIRNFASRVDAATENFVTLAKELGNPAAITEIRLLSPGNLFVEDAQQILETYLAAIRSKKNITLFNYGINIARVSEVALQEQINTRAINQLFEKVFNALNIPFTLGADIKQKRQMLDAAVCQLDLTNASQACSQFHRYWKNIIHMKLA